MKWCIIGFVKKFDYLRKCKQQVSNHINFSMSFLVYYLIVMAVNFFFSFDIFSFPNILELCDSNQNFKNYSIFLLQEQKN